MIRAVLVDDEPPARVRMRQLLEAAGDVTVVGEAGSAMEARDVIRDTRPDLLFLDVEMPEVRGTALAASLPEPRPFIVFATAFESYALDAIALDATDYLLKPVSRAKLAATLERVRARLLEQSDLERDVAAASDVQAQMWPGALPAIPGFDCAAASLPARGVGGDFYDAFAHRRASTLGPAARRRVRQRHGGGPGRVGRAGARAHARPRSRGSAPRRLMAAVDRDVYATTDGARYATAIYAELDAADPRVRARQRRPSAGARARSGSGDAIVRIDATGPALGLIEAGVFGRTA